MYGTRTLATLLDEQTSVLRTQLTGVLDGRGEAVHDSRVATRRIRELLALVPAIPGRDGEADVATGYKEMGRALGRVRDIDVQIELIKTLEAHAPQAAPSLVVVRQDHDNKRLAKMRRLIKTLERLDVDALLHFVGDGHPAGLRTRLTSSGWRQQIKRLLVERSRTATDAIAHATGVYFPKRTHRARIAIKQLRYAGEIALRTGFEQLDPAVGVLKRSQQVLGDLHDRHVLGDSLKSYTKHEDVDADHVKLTRQVLEGDVLSLHADYLSRRDGLLEACASVQEVASRSSDAMTRIGIGAAVAVSSLFVARALSSVRTNRETLGVLEHRPAI